MQLVKPQHLDPAGGDSSERRARLMSSFGLHHGNGHSHHDANAFLRQFPIVVPGELEAKTDDELRWMAFVMGIIGLIYQLLTSRNADQLRGQFVHAISLPRVGYAPKFHPRVA